MHHSTRTMVYRCFIPLDLSGLQKVVLESDRCPTPQAARLTCFTWHQHKLMSAFIQLHFAEDGEWVKKGWGYRAKRERLGTSNAFDTFKGALHSDCCLANRELSAVSFFSLQISFNEHLCAKYSVAVLYFDPLSSLQKVHVFSFCISKSWCMRRSWSELWLSTCLALYLYLQFPLNELAFEPLLALVYGRGILESRCIRHISSPHPLSSHPDCNKRSTPKFREPASDRATL